MVYIISAVVGVLLLPFIVLFCVYIGSIVISAILDCVDSYKAAWKKTIDIIFGRGE